VNAGGPVDRGDGRNARGQTVDGAIGLATRFSTGNTASLRGGLRARRLFERDAVAAVLRATERRILTDGGDADDPTFTRESTARQLARVEFLLDSTFEQLVATGGPFSSRGRIRAVHTALMQLADRHLALVRLLGLERRARPVETLQDYLARQYGARAAQTQQDASATRGEGEGEAADDRGATGGQEGEADNQEGEADKVEAGAPSASATRRTQDHQQQK